MIDLDPRIRRIREPFFRSPAVAVLIANHSGGCTRCQSNCAENSSSSGLEILHYAFPLRVVLAPFRVSTSKHEVSFKKKSGPRRLFVRPFFA